MAEATVMCPICLQADAIQFYEGTENGAPHGAGYWPMQVSDVFQECECDLSEEQLKELGNQAWQPIQAEYDAYAEELEAVMRELDDSDLAAPTEPVYHAPGCYCILHNKPDAG